MEREIGAGDRRGEPRSSEAGDGRGRSWSRGKNGEGDDVPTFRTASLSPCESLCSLSATFLARLSI